MRTLGRQLGKHRIKHLHRPSLVQGLVAVAALGALHARRAAGGAGFAERGHTELVRWLTATRDAVAACECATGCPSCVQSPKCGNGNEPLHKAGAVQVLGAVLAELAS